MEINREQVAAQLRAVGASEEEIPKLIADIDYHLAEHGVAQIFGMPDGSFKVGSPKAPPRGGTIVNPSAMGSPFAGMMPQPGLPQDDGEDFEMDPSDTVARNIGTYLDVLQARNQTENEELKTKLARLAGVLETKLGEDVEDYISSTQLEARQAKGIRAEKRLAAWKAEVSSGNTQLSFKEWDESLPEV